MQRPIAYLFAVSALFVLPVGVSADDAKAPNIARLLSGTWNGAGH